MKKIGLNFGGKQMKLEIKNWRVYFNDSFVIRLDAPFWKLLITVLAMLAFIVLLGITEM